MKNNTQPALKERIEKALEDFTKGRASMHVPPFDTDVDVVLAECSDRLSELEARCAALAAEVYDLKHPGTYLPSKCETPALDAFLAEVRAQGVEMFAASLKVVGGHEHPYSAVAKEFAAQLRKGVQQ
ncbi:hypothetical protein [Enterobacter asburiae]|uniref:hypothetical protein n=1 Tax=Enterobacter asburiae TaxID=61645 RepID=UPI001E3F60B4|nr:hypothetical protein [Enterobacter asburiae]MCE2000811.1 hypothetical protein [Enterobacter asburiae]